MSIGPITRINYSLSGRPRTNWAGVVTILDRSQERSARVTAVCDISDFQSDGAATTSLYAVLARAAQVSLEPFSWSACAPRYDFRQYWPHGGDMTHYPSSTKWHAFAAALCTPAPHLQRFELRTSSAAVSSAPRGRESLHLHPETFTGEAAQLQACYLAGITMPSLGCQAFSRLTLFEYQPIPCHEQP